jgi:NAD/NADP transhydrogenase alpha subunit
MTQAYETGGRVSMSDLSARQPHELLLLLGAAIAILLSLVLFAIQWYQGITTNQLSGATTAVILNVVLGAALWVSAAITRKNLMNGAIVAGVVGLILIAFGGQVGVIAGIIGLLGAILAAATPYLPWSRGQHH